MVFKVQKKWPRLLVWVVLAWGENISAYTYNPIPSIKLTRARADKVRRHALEIREGVHFGIRR